MPDTHRGNLTLGRQFFGIGGLLLPGALVMARELFLNAYGAHVLNIHTSPVFALLSVLSFYVMCGWVVLGVVMLGVAVARGMRVHIAEVLGLLAGASLVGAGLFISGR